MKRFIFFVILQYSVFITFAQQTEWNSARILLEIEKLNTTGSVLYIAAHPDDENTRLITYLANEKKVRTGYLSLTRGDGGQNLIGDEQGAYLGVIRTQELMAARRTDGGEQFFTRAVDFGYSKNATETFTKWNHDSLLADVVWVIRNFRPDIIITRFPPDERAGHGQHTASAMLAEEAFDAAADATKFPEQLQYVSVWQAQRLFWNTSLRWDAQLADQIKNNDKNVVAMNTGMYNPLLGKSYGEIAAESRTNHKSQGFGSTPVRGEQIEYLYLKKGTQVPAGKDIFDGIYLTWERYRQGAELKIIFENVIKTFQYSAPELSIDKLLEAYQFMNTMPQDQFIDFKKQQLLNCISACLGLWIEPVALLQFAVENSEIKIENTMLIRRNYPVTITSVTAGSKNIQYQKTLISEKNTIDTVSVFIDGNNSSSPYWLHGKYNGLFHVADQKMIGKAENDAAVSFIYHLKMKDVEVDLKRAVVYKETDAVKGEIVEPLLVKPRVEVSFDEKNYVFLNGKIPQVTVHVKNNNIPFNATLKLKLPEGWYSEPEQYQFNLSEADSGYDAKFIIHPANNQTQAMISASVSIPTFESSYSYHTAYDLISYDHIPTQLISTNAEAKLSFPDSEIPTKKICYIEGAGDKVDESLLHAGFNIITIKPEQITAEELVKYDVIIIGVRAYNISKTIAERQHLLMDYVKNGGLLITQYSTNWDSYAEQIGPYPFKISRGRVTDENSPVTFLLPEHALLNVPNKISQNDFKDWVQERGIYFADQLSAEYQTPLAFTDPGEQAQNGSVIIADYGKGAFIYTGIAFFRELPTGVSGAYRLFINMIEYKGQ